MLVKKPVRSRSRLRDFLAIDERESVVKFAQTPLGKVALFACVLFLLLLPPVAKRLEPPLWVLLFAAMAAAHAYFPRFRAVILLVATWSVAFFGLPAYTYRDLALVTLMIGSACSLYYVKRHKTSLYARRPVVTLLCTLALLTAFAILLPDGTARDMTWSFVMIFNGYIWFLSYAITDQRSRHPSPGIVQMGVLRPFWVNSSNPIGKGAVFLKRHLATNSRDLAITQLKGLKLLIWMDVLIALALSIHWLCMGQLHIPTQHQAVAAFVNHQPYPVLVNWVAITIDTVLFTLHLAVFGHNIVGLARLAGYRLPRNMCRPLESRTLAEFWNRYNFYFKEVMVDFFYVPTFLKVFRNHPRVRMFFATFMAAGVGNLIFHFIRDIPDIHTMGLWKTIESYASYTFYCVMLSVGIGISQLRQHAGIQPPTTRLGRLRAFFIIWTFIVILQDFDVMMRDFTFSQNFAFNAGLFGLR